MGYSLIARHARSIVFAYSLRAEKRFIYLASLLMVVCGATPGLGENLPEVSARPPWTLLSQSDDAKSGYVLHRRPTPGSDAPTFRLEAILDSPPELVAIAAARYMTDPEYRGANMDKKVLRNDEEVIVIYNYIHVNAPFVSDRDVISRIERSYDPDSKTYRLEWRAIDEGPPKQDGVVRLERSEGYWAFSPAEEGTTRAVYVSHTESAGYVPEWVVTSRMSKTMVEGIEGLRRVVNRERSERGD